MSDFNYPDQHFRIAKVKTLPPRGLYPSHYSPAFLYTRDDQKVMELALWLRSESS